MTGQATPECLPFPRDSKALIYGSQSAGLEAPWKRQKCSKRQQLREANRSPSGLSDRRQQTAADCPRLTSRRSPVRAGRRPFAPKAELPQAQGPSGPFLGYLVARCGSARLDDGLIWEPRRAEARPGRPSCPGGADASPGEPAISRSCRSWCRNRAWRQRSREASTSKQPTSPSARQGPPGVNRSIMAIVSCFGRASPRGASPAVNRRQKL